MEIRAGEPPPLALSQPGAVAHRLTAIFPAKGGSGATSLATHLAGALALRGERTCLLDLDPTFGGVASALETQGGLGIVELLGQLHRLDEALLDRSLARHSSGAFVLGHGERVEDAERVGPREVASLLAFLSRHFRQVLVDGVRGFDEPSLAALDAADRMVLVATQEVPSLRNAGRAVELFRRLGYPDEKLMLVLNRFHKGARIGPKIAAETAGLPVAATLSNDFAALSEALNRGVLLAQSAPRSTLWQELEALARRLAQGPEPAEAAPRKPLLWRLFSRGRR